jgi:hypothetical protein
MKNEIVKLFLTYGAQLDKETLEFLYKFPDLIPFFLVATKKYEISFWG